LVVANYPRSLRSHCDFSAFKSTRSLRERSARPFSLVRLAPMDSPGLSKTVGFAKVGESID